MLPTKYPVCWQITHCRLPSGDRRKMGRVVAPTEKSWTPELTMYIIYVKCIDSLKFLYVSGSSPPNFRLAFMSDDLRQKNIQNISYQHMNTYNDWSLNHTLKFQNRCPSYFETILKLCWSYFEVISGYFKLFWCYCLFFEAMLRLCWCYFVLFWSYFEAMLKLFSCFFGLFWS